MVNIDKTESLFLDDLCKNEIVLKTTFFSNIQTHILSTMSTACILKTVL